MPITPTLMKELRLTKLETTTLPLIGERNVLNEVEGYILVAKVPFHIRWVPGEVDIFSHCCVKWRTRGTWHLRPPTCASLKNGKIKGVTRLLKCGQGLYI